MMSTQRASHLLLVWSHSGWFADYSIKSAGLPRDTQKVDEFRWGLFMIPLSKMAQNSRTRKKSLSCRWHSMIYHDPKLCPCFHHGTWWFPIPHEKKPGVQHLSASMAGFFFYKSGYGKWQYFAWNKAIGWFLLWTMIPGFGRFRKVVIINMW